MCLVQKSEETKVTMAPESAGQSDRSVTADDGAQIAPADALVPVESAIDVIAPLFSPLSTNRKEPKSL